MTTKQLNVLVLGVGGNVSQGILKALNLSSLSCRVVAACTSPESFGLFTSVRSYVSPTAHAPEFLPWILDVCRREEVHSVLSGVEPVLDALLQHSDAISTSTGAICLTNAPRAVEVGRDKLRTCEWLRDHGFNYPAFASSDDADGLQALAKTSGFPLLAKPRAGKGSSGIFLIREPESLRRVRDLPDYVVQEYLGDDSTEFTVSCFTDRDDEVRGIIVLRRRLLQGTTLVASAGHYPELRREAERIAAALRPRGPLNIQMRIHRGKPVCFEMNVRFSGTTPMRARLGFNDVESALRHYVLGEPAADLPLITEGHVLRYWNELYVDAKAIEALARDGCLQPLEYPVEIEDYGAQR